MLVQRGEAGRPVSSGEGGLYVLRTVLLTELQAGGRSVAGELHVPASRVCQCHLLCRAAFRTGTDWQVNVLQC